MNTFKNKTRILTYLICFSVLSLINIGCENNDDFEEIIEQTDKVKKAEAKNAAKANIKTGRTRVKQRPNGLYRTAVTVKDKNNEVNAVALEIEQKEGFIKETKTYYLKYFTTINGEKYFTNGDIKFENKEIDNQDITVNITLLDAKKQPIGKTTTEVVTVAGLANANVKIESILIKQDFNGLCKLTAKTDGLNTELHQIEIQLESTQEGNKITSFEVTSQKNGRIKSSFKYDGNSKLLSMNYIFKDIFGDVLYKGEKKLVRASVIKRQERIRASYKERLKSAEY